MRKAILHLGLHKTGTTFLQLSMRRWLDRGADRHLPVFFSSQHMPSSKWKKFRSEFYVKFRNAIARAPLGPVPANSAAIQERLGNLGLLPEFEMLRDFFDRPETVLVHSDENSLGAMFGHLIGSRREVIPFYPNGDWLSAIFAAAAHANFDDVEVVLTLRRFDELIVSSLKSIIRSERGVPPIDMFLAGLRDMGARCRSIIEATSRLQFVSSLHILEFQTLQTSPQRYFEAFCGLTGADRICTLPNGHKVNPSITDNEALNRLVASGSLNQAERARCGTLSDLIGRDFLHTLAKDYESLQHDLAAAGHSKRVNYYN
jgi:hypothetical protein